MEIHSPWMVWRLNCPGFHFCAFWILGCCCVEKLQGRKKRLFQMGYLAFYRTVSLDWIGVGSQFGAGARVELYGNSNLSDAVVVCTGALGR
jgi:hypothetical protein